jgi:hypothetical protein
MWSRLACWEYAFSDYKYVSNCALLYLMINLWICSNIAHFGLRSESEKTNLLIVATDWIVYDIKRRFVLKFHPIVPFCLCRVKIWRALCHGIKPLLWSLMPTFCFSFGLSVSSDGLETFLIPPWAFDIHRVNRNYEISAIVHFYSSLLPALL